MSEVTKSIIGESADRKSRVFVLNNYPLDRVIREVDLAETPDHVLFGVDRLADMGYEPIFLPYPAEGFWSRVQGWVKSLRLPLELGDLQQQVLALREMRKGDVIYAPCGSQTHLLQYLRALGLLKVPIVTLMHHPFPKGKLDIFRSCSGVSLLRVLTDCPHSAAPWRMSLESGVALRRSVKRWSGGPTWTSMDLGHLLGKG